MQNPALVSLAISDLKIIQKAINVVLQIILESIANTVLKPYPTSFTHI